MSDDQAPEGPPIAGKWNLGPPPPEREVTQSDGARRQSRTRRFGVMALAGALVAGGGAGAMSAAVVDNSSSSATTFKTVSVAVTPTAATTKGKSGTVGIVSKVEPALVDIHTTGSDTTSSSPLFGSGTDPYGGSSSQSFTAAGTGQILTSDGLVLTNAHVLANATTITVDLNGSTKAHRATLVGEDAAKDIALIKISGVSGLPTVTLGGSSSVSVGDSVLAIGNALDLQNGGFTVSNGIISATSRSILTNNAEKLTGLIQTSAAISSGDSGGALVNASGQVIGMNTAAATSSSNDSASNIGFAIPIDEIKALIPTLEKGSIGAVTTSSPASTSGTSTGTG